MSDSLTKAAESLDACMERCRTVAAVHADVRNLHPQIADTNLRAKFEAAHQAVADGHDALTRSLEAAQLAVDGADDDDDYVEPNSNTSGQGGTMTSSGREDGSLPGRAYQSPWGARG